jgi:hypothetical protein
MSRVSSLVVTPATSLAASHGDGSTASPGRSSISTRRLMCVLAPPRRARVPPHMDGRHPAVIPAARGSAVTTTLRRPAPPHDGLRGTLTTLRRQAPPHGGVCGTRRRCALSAAVTVRPTTRGRRGVADSPEATASRARTNAAAITTTTTAPGTGAAAAAGARRRGAIARSRRCGGRARRAARMTCGACAASCSSSARHATRCGTCRPSSLTSCCAARRSYLSRMGTRCSRRASAWAGYSSCWLGPQRCGRCGSNAHTLQQL